MSNRKWHSSRGWIGAIGLTVVSFAVATALLSQGHFFTDNINYLSYRPDPVIESFAETTAMSSRGKFLFYASHPVLENAEGFNEKCGRSEVSTAILGCYNGQTIHIYNIEDDRLRGIRETTAAHEMLHAAYDRLSRGEKEKVNKLLQNELEKLKDDESVAERLAYYDRSQPGEQDNELHSIIGTEIEGIDPDLEMHYSRYFSDRAQVVSLHNRYESVFKELKTQADALSRRIAELDTVIKNDTMAYNNSADLVKDDIASFNERAGRGDFNSQAEFNRERNLLMKRVNDLETVRSRINTNVEVYNGLVVELNGVATQTQDLNRSVDSTLTPAPSL